MTFRQFLQMAEGLWGSKGQFTTGLTKKTAPSAIAKKDLYNSPGLGQGGAGAAGAPPTAPAKKMRKKMDRD